MAGDGPQLKRVKSFIQRNGMKDDVILPGMVHHSGPLLADTSILLVVSRLEGIPLVLAESMSMRVPTVSVNVGAISELIEDGLNGFLIEPGGDVVDEFTDRVLGLLSDSEVYYRIAEKAR
jgi:L-malate glycosyltransferase